MIYCKNSCPRISTTDGIEVVNQQGVSNGAESHDNLRNLSYHATLGDIVFNLVTMKRLQFLQLDRLLDFSVMFF